MYLFARTIPPVQKYYTSTASPILKDNTYNYLSADAQFGNTLLQRDPALR